MVNLHAKSRFPDSKLRRICPVEAVDTVSTNNTVLSLTTDHSAVFPAWITSWTGSSVNKLVSKQASSRENTHYLHGFLWVFYL